MGIVAGSSTQTQTVKPSTNFAPSKLNAQAEPFVPQMSAVLEYCDDCGGPILDDVCSFCEEEDEKRMEEFLEKIDEEEMDEMRIATYLEGIGEDDESDEDVAEEVSNDNSQPCKEKGSVPCKFGDKCRFRETCKFSHEKKVIPCKFGDKCRFRETCKFSH